MKILVSNVGSTSLKFKLFEMPQETVLCTGKAERVGSADDAIFAYENCLTGYREKHRAGIPSYTEGIGMFADCMLDPEKGVLGQIQEVEAVGFKTVAAKGFFGVHELTGEVMEAMRDYMSVAPAHNAAYLEAVGCFRQMLPQARFIGVFETAFHRTIPLKRKLYSLPYEWYETYGVQKLGYHGASHSYAASVLEELFGSTKKAVTCHLGGSGSICAVEDGKSTDTSFGMSLQIGVPQSNRVGDMDPYVIRYLEDQGLTEDEIFEAMTKKSGLLGVSGVDKDLRYIMDAAGKGDRRAALAVDMFVDSVLHYIGAYAAKMGGLDYLVFTGGIGENSVYVREEVCKKLAFLGLLPDEEANRHAVSGEEYRRDPFTGGDPDDERKNRICREKGVRIISRPESALKVLVIPANEEIIVGRRTYDYLTG